MCFLCLLWLKLPRGRVIKWTRCHYQRGQLSRMDTHTAKRLTAEHRLPAVPGFTWELFCIAVIFLSALAITAAVAIAAANNKDPKLPYLLTALVLWVLTLKV